MMRMAVECKRPRDASWIFLVPKGSLTNTERVRCQWTTIDHRIRRLISHWHDFQISPASPQAAFCAIRGKGEGDASTLERWSGQLLTASDCLAIEEGSLSSKKTIGFRRIYFPAIVTTAQLEVCYFNPNDISLDKGSLKTGKGKFEPVPFIRFRQSLTTQLSEATYIQNLEQANQDRERTVFVINASNISAVLKDWQIDKGSYPWTS
jgi:hypothetical protein